MKKISRKRIQNTLKKFLQTGRWDSSLFERRKKFLQHRLIQSVESVAAQGKSDLIDKNFTIESFHQFCETENIKIFRNARADVKSFVAGEFTVNLKTGKTQIWLKPNLRAKKLLYVAAHELAHYLLHREKMMRGLLRNPLGLSNLWDLPVEFTLAEIEADLLACLLLSSEVKNETR